MKKVLYIILAVVLLASCQKDSVVEMSNNSLQLRFQMLGNASVEVSRASEATESDVNNVMVYIFNEDGNIAVDPVYLNQSQLTLTESGNYARTYTAEVKTSESLKDGKYYVFAIANTETDMWKLSEANLDYSTYANFVKALISASWLEPLGANITMTGHCGSDGSANVSGGTLSSTIYLKRPYAKATFKFQNSAENIVFTPESYSLYNLPGKAPIFENSGSNASAFWNSEGMAFSTQSQNAFTFYQLENQQSASDVTRYHDRAINAPEEASYVVVKGTYKEYATDDEGNVTTTLKYTGDVSYKIHLGDFSAANANDYNDFNVLRNTSYTYTVTVHGVNSIIVEAKKEEADYENGAEGYIIDAAQSKMIYTLDAHYETVQLRIPVDGLFDSSDPSKSLNISVSTPMMPEANRNAMIDWNIINGSMTDDEFYAAYDLKWVEFVPASSAAFATYPGQGKALYIRDFVKQLYYAVDPDDTTTSSITVVEESDGRVAYVTCFVNEYYYDGELWPEFVGKENRTLNFIQAPEVSTDKNSIYAQTLFSFSQKSIETPYKYDASINGFGLETYNESGALLLHPDITTGQDCESGNGAMKGADDAQNGRDNMLTQVGITTGTSEWADYTTESGYSYEGQSAMTYNKMTTNYAYAYAACMQRNRDNNGDGFIDGDEVRWYLASVNQYRTMWLGEKGLVASAALFTGDLSTITSATYDYQDHYFTNSYWENRIFWAVEGASTGRYSTNYMNETQHIRCVRNLATVESTTAEMDTDGEWYWDSNNAGALYIASNLSDKATRNLGMVGEYVAHNERASQNALPKAFVMAKQNLSNELNVTTETVTTYTTVGAPQIASADFSESVSASASVTLSDADYSDSKFSVTLSAALPTGVSLYYATSTTGTKTAMTVSGTTATSGTVNTSSSGPMSSATIYVWLYNGSEYSTDYATINYTKYFWDSGSTEISDETLSIEGGTSSAYTITLSNADTNKTYYWSATDGTNGTAVTPASGVLTIETTSSPIYIWCTAVNNDGTTMASGTSSVTSAGVITNNSATSDVSTSTTNTTYTTGSTLYVYNSSDGTGVASEDNYCAKHYYENDDYSDLGKWRVPNQRETVVLAMYSDLSTSDSKAAEDYYLSRTQPSVSDIYSARGMYLYYNTAARLSWSAAALSVRCVRDATADEVAAKTPTEYEYDAEFEDGGDLTE